jgi:dipeptidyl aminopeptidase/acylaminoacyl peptidase
MLQKFSYHLKKNTWKLSNVNTATYSSLTLSKTERRYVTTTDGKKMLVWVVLPSNFDAKKISNTFILSRWTTIAIDVLHSYRWNLQLMAANGYIVVAQTVAGMQGMV